jgi:hypothetical protein
MEMFAGPWAKGTNLGGKIWLDMMKQTMGLMSGAISPTQLPETSRFKQDMETQLKLILNEVMRTATAKGIEGGALAKLMGNIKEQGVKGMLNYLQNIYATTPQKAMALSEQALGMRKLMNQLMMQAGIANMQRKSQEDIAKHQQQTSAIMQGIGMASKGISGGIGGAMGEVMGGTSGGGITGSYTGAPSLDVTTDVWDWDKIAKSLGYI